jgi:hypothetical protein
LRRFLPLQSLPQMLNAGVSAGTDYADFASGQFRAEIVSGG